MIFGSHLYGTSTENSDTDYKGVFMPSEEQILLGKIPKSYNQSTGKSDSKNSSEDIDTEIYSLHYFIKLALEGQTVAIDMIHAPNQFILESSDIWLDIVRNKRKFYTKNLNAFVGYARRQASKYGIKGSRLDASKTVYDILISHDPEIKISNIWNKLPENEYCKFLGKNQNGIKEYQVCGRTIQETGKIGYCADVVKKFYENYGERAKQAAQNKGIDWKAVSHAVRAAIQVKMILVDGDIKFPLPQADLILKIKQGKLDYLTEAGPILENMMSEVEELSLKSNLPSKPDYEFWERFIIDNVRKKIL